MDLNAALRWLNFAVMSRGGHALREPELVILKGTWRGLTYEQMADGSDYSTNYLMRDVAPKLWRQLSAVFNRSVGKTNFRVALDAYVAAHLNDIANDIDLAAASSNPDSLNAVARFTQSSSTQSGSNRAEHAFSNSESYPGWHVLPSEQSETAHLSNPVGQPPELAVSTTVPMYGYDAEFAQLKQWISDTLHTRIVGIWGLKGIGKTLLAQTVIAQVGDHFTGSIRRSLYNRPSLDELSASILSSLGINAFPQPSEQLLAVMSQRSLLILLEDVEFILQPGTLAGDYAPEHRAYSKFFQLARASRSCILLTGIVSG